MNIRVLLASLVIFSCAAYGQLLVSDNFNITGGNSISNGFGPDGVNTQITDTSRITGEAVTNNLLSYFPGGAKPDSVYSISNNTLQVGLDAGVGQIQFTADGTNAFDFASYLVGKAYEFTITMDNDSVDATPRRMSLSIGTAPGQTVDRVPLGVQLQADADSSGAEVIKRVSGAFVSDGQTINQPIASGLAYGEPVTLKVKIVDVDSSVYFLSSYEIYLNDNPTPIDSGTFGIQSGSRYVIFDIAPNTGPCSYDDFSLTVISNAPTAPPPPVTTADRSPIYFVGNDGAIYQFTGFTTETGSTPITNASVFTEGIPMATNASYGTYQAMTMDPDSGAVYGVDSLGNMIKWPSLNDWISDANSTVEVAFAYGPDGGQGGVHGVSYDPLTGGYYVVFEGDASIDGDIGQFATLNDFLNGINWTQSAAGYGGNILNFYYWAEDAPGNFSSMDLGAHYFQAAGSGQLEGWQTLTAYIAAANNRTFQQSGFCVGCVAAFSVPLPPDIVVDLVSVQKDAGGTVNGVTLDWETSGAMSYSVLGSTDITGSFTLVPGYSNVTNTPVAVTLPAGYEAGGFFQVQLNP